MTAESDDRSKPKKPSLIRRSFMIVGRVVGTVAVIGAAGFAVQYGASELTRRAEAAPIPDAAPAIPVATSPLSYQDGYEVTRAFIGQIEPAKTVALSFELPGRLQSIQVDEGDRVTAGQVVAVQDTSLLDAERSQLLATRSATSAQLKLAYQTVERSEELAERGFATQARLDDALARRDELEARIAEIDAALQNVEIRFGKSTITAPFSGRITTRSVDGGETLGAGQAVLGMVETGASVVRVGVPVGFDEARLSEAKVQLDEETLEAELVTLRPDIDPITRTRTAIFELKGVASASFGQTARLLTTERVAAEGLWVPLTSLQEGLRGQWTVLVVAPDDTVQSAPVEILHAESQRVFARGGFPDGTRLIDEGPQRVAVGQLVTTETDQ